MEDKIETAKSIVHVNIAMPLNLSSEFINVATHILSRTSPINN